MGLATEAIVRDLLLSPCCRAKLAALTCSACGCEFGTVEGKPVLVDFKRSILTESMVYASAASSPVRRRRLGSFSKALKPRTESESAENVASLMRLLPKLPRILVVGGGTLGEGLGALYESDAEIVAFDIYSSPHIHVIGDAHQIPFADATFDAVVVQAVLEHVLSPQEVVDEIWRVLHPEGLVYAETPFLQPVHEGPYDFTRFTESGHRWLFRNFERLHAGVIGGPLSSYSWALNYLVRSLTRSRLAGLFARAALLPFMKLERTIPRAYAIDAAAGVFFLGRRSSGPVISPHEMVAYYSGAQG